MSTAALAASPVLVPLATALLTALCPQRPQLQRVLSGLGIAALLGCALLLVALAGDDRAVQTSFGNWAAPYGIAFVIDRTGAALVLVTALMGAATLLFMLSDADPVPAHPLVLPLLHGLLAGVGGAFATADLFNLYVWFEVMLICALGLFAIGGRRDQLDACFKYMSLNLFGTLLLLMAVGLVYGLTGQLNFGALAGADAVASTALGGAVLAMLALAFLVKAGAFPVFAWLPASYHTLPAPLLALFAALLTKVGVYAVMRLLGDVFSAPPAWLSEALGWVAVATMIAGVLGAAYHWDIRRILAFHIVSQIGYILLAVALHTPAAYAAALFYTLHHIVVKANLFLIGAIICRRSGSWDLRDGGGLYLAAPGLALLFMVPALSLVGIPPLSGFWAKLLVLREALAQGQAAWVAAALLVSVLTLYSMLKIWMEAFWKPPPAEPAKAWLAPRLTAAYAATGALALLTLAIGLHPQGLLDYAVAATAGFGGR
jgi:multicomponent Na+:H+ antiporter subunit D